MVLYIMTDQYLEELIRKYASGSATDEEIQTLTQWYQTLDEVQWRSENADEKLIVSRRMLDRLQKEISATPAKIIRFRWLRVAAIVAFALGLGTIWIYISRPSSDSFITVSNPSGKIQLVSLPDNSKVWLNANTTIRYSKSFEQKRTIELDGEAYFEVTHDDEHTFIVRAGGIESTDLGTSFNIKAYNNGDIIGVSVITGKVKVTDSTKTLGVLTPSLHLQYNRTNHTAQTSTIDSNAVLAWTKGKLQFQGESFAEIARTLENWYGVRIVFTNPGMLHCRYYMSFDNTISLNKLLLMMSEITEMKYVYDRSKNIITLSGQECN